MSRTLLGDRGPSDLTVRAGQRPPLGLRRTVSALAIVTVTRAASAAGIGAVTDGESHLAILGRMTDLGTANTSGQGKVTTAATLVTSGGDPVAAGDVLTGIRVVRSAPGASAVTETVRLDATVRAAAIAFTKAPALGTVRAGDRPEEAAVDPGAATASNGRPVTIEVALARGGTDFASGARWQTAPAAKDDIVRARFTASAQGATASVVDAQTTVLAAIAAPAGPAVPRILEAPVLTPASAVTGERLRIAGGRWAGEPSAFDRRWLRDGVVLKGINGSEYVPVLADEASAITAQMRAINAAGWSDWVTATGSTAVAAAPPPTGPIAYHMADAKAPGFSVNAAAVTISAGGRLVYDGSKGQAAIRQLIGGRVRAGYLYQHEMDVENTAGSFAPNFRIAGYDRWFETTYPGPGRRTSRSYFKLQAEAGADDRFEMAFGANDGIVTVHSDAMSVAPVLAGPNLMRFDRAADVQVVGDLTYTPLGDGKFRAVSGANGYLRLAAIPGGLKQLGSYRAEFDIEVEGPALQLKLALQLRYTGNVPTGFPLRFFDGNVKRYAGANDFTLTAAEIAAQTAIHIEGFKDHPAGTSFVFHTLTVKAL